MEKLIGYNSQFINAIENNYEIEIRLGKYDKNVFIADNSLEQFKQFTNSNKLVFKESVKTALWLTSSNGRIVYTLNNEYTTISKFFMIKNRKFTVDYPQFNFRIGVSIETIVDKITDKASAIRFRDRNIFHTSDGLWKYELTKVIYRKIANKFDVKDIWNEVINAAKNNHYDNYEIECEYIGGNNEEYKHKIIDIIATQIDFISNTLNLNYHFKIIENNYSFDMFIKDVRKYYKSFSINGFHDITNKAISLEYSLLGTLEINDYAITDKTDGLRHLLWQSSKSEYSILINSGNESTPLVLKLKEKGIFYPNTLIDGELVNSDLFVVFDIIIFNGNNIENENLIERLQMLEQFVDQYSQTQSSIKIIRKEFQLVINNEFKITEGDKTKIEYITDVPIYRAANKIIKKVNKLPYPTDGLIFTPIKKPYLNSHIYKWKPPHLVTIDFLIQKRKENKNITEYYLFVGCNKFIWNKLIETNGYKLPNEYSTMFPFVNDSSNYFPILFYPNYSITIVNNDIKKFNIHDNTIIELAFDKQNGKWVFIKNREDKTKEYQISQSNFGNNWNTALNNWNIIQNPITEAMIIGKEKIPFYTTENKITSRQYTKSMRAYHNLIKNYMYITYAKNVNWLFEIGGGRFGDLHKWIVNNIVNVMITDIDENGLKEGIERYERLEKKPKVNIFTGIADFTREYNNPDFQNNCDVVAAQFSLQFFMGSEQMFETFVENVSRLLKPKGIFMATVLDGRKVFDLIEKNNIKTDQTLEFKIEEKTVFSFKKLYNGNDFVKYGGEISVFVESIGKFHKEFLIDIKEVEAKFKKAGYKLVENTPFEKFDNLLKSKNLELSSVEREYSYMNNVMVFKRAF